MAAVAAVAAVATVATVAAMVTGLTMLLVLSGSPPGNALRKYSNFSLKLAMKSLSKGPPASMARSRSLVMSMMAWLNRTSFSSRSLYAFRAIVVVVVVDPASPVSGPAVDDMVVVDVGDMAPPVPARKILYKAGRWSDGLDDKNLSKKTRTSSRAVGTHATANSSLQWGCVGGKAILCTPRYLWRTWPLWIK